VLHDLWPEWKNPEGSGKGSIPLTPEEVLSHVIEDEDQAERVAREIKDFRILGTCPTPVAGSSDITGLYTARYGVPKAGTKVYVQVNQVVDGWESLPRAFSAIVPAS